MGGKGYSQQSEPTKGEPVRSSYYMAGGCMTHKVGKHNANY